jgi:hypothetical protein
MKYVDWVERVLRAVVDAFDAGDGFAAGIGAIRRELGVDLDERAEPLWDALRDLERLGLIDTSNGHFVKIDQEARKIRGFDPKSHEFTTTADPSVTQDRIEDVLNEYTEPPVTVRYATFPWTDDSGEAGLLEIKRDRTRVPYRVRRSLRGAKNAIDVREVFVRHGSHIAVASSEEVKDLEDEAARARQG